MKLKEIVERAEKDAFVVQCTHEPLCEEYRLAREMAYAVARAVVEECEDAIDNCYGVAPEEFAKGLLRAKEIVRALAKQIDEKEK